MNTARFVVIALLGLLPSLASKAGDSNQNPTASEQGSGATANQEQDRELRRHKRPGLVRLKPPKAPGRVDAEVISPTQIIFRWADFSDNEEGFKIERSTDGRQFSQIAQVLPNSTQYRDARRFPGTKYFYRVRAFNSAGSSDFSRPASALTPVSSCNLSVASIDQIGRHSLPASSIPWVAVAAGGDHGLALNSEGHVEGWSIVTPNSAATIPSDLENVVAIAAGEAHSLALKRDGTVAGWGSNDHGQSAPPPGLSNVVAIAAGSLHSLALKSDGTVVGWGNNWQGAATPPPGLTGVVAIAAGEGFSLALRSDGRVVGWGYDVLDQATPPWDLTNVVAIAAGQSRGLALKSDGTVVAWGGAYDPTIFSPETPSLTGLIAIAEANHASAGLKRDGSLVVWRYSDGWSAATALRGVVAISVYGGHLIALSATPNPPPSIRATLIASNLVHLVWPESSNGQDSFMIERSSASNPDNWVLIAHTPVGVTNFDDTTVNPDEGYTYRVRSDNDCAASRFQYGGFTQISAPLNPPDNIYGFVLANEARLTGGDSYGDGATGYTIERAPDDNDSPGEWSVLITTNFPPLSSSFEFADAGWSIHSNYWYRFRVFNVLGDSPFCTPVRIQIVPPTVPDYPYARINVSNSVLLTWPAWSSTFPHYQTGFIVERSADPPNPGETWTPLATVTNAIDSGQYSDTNATLGSTYRYRIRAFNVLGVSPPSLEAAITITSPSKPSLGCEVITTSARLGWYNPDYLGIVERFIIERADDASGGPGIWKVIADVHAANGENPQSFTDTSLKPDTTYWYRLKTINWTGESPFSDPIRVEIVPPPPPFITSVLMGRSNVVVLSWSAWYVKGLEGIRVERALDASGAPGNWSELGKVFTSSSLGSKFEDTNAPPNTTCWYRMRTFNSAGTSAYSEPLRFNVFPPSQPVLSAHATSTNVILYFNALEPGVLGFRLERAKDVNGSPKSWKRIATVQPRNIPSAVSMGIFTDSNIPPATAFWYRVRAFNWAGDSEYSAAASAAILPAESTDTLTTSIAQSIQASLSISPGGTSTNQQIKMAAPILTNDSVLIAWIAAAGTTNIVESTTEPGGEFVAISPPMVIQDGAGFFLHTGVLTNSPTRYYRIRLAR